MIDFRLSDPEFVGFVPKNAAEAIIKFRRLQQKGLHPMQYPETLVALAKALPGAEVDKMNDWIICPQGVPTGTECTVIAANTRTNKSYANRKSHLLHRRHKLRLRGEVAG